MNTTSFEQKASVAEIRARFDNDVERFSQLETGQSTMVDGALILDLLTEAAAATNPQARRVLDVGCGAGNYTLKLLQRLPDLDVTLIDLSRPMLERAAARIGPKTNGRIHTIQGDVRKLALGEMRFDVIMAAAVLHHLRGDEEWKAVFAALYAALRPGGSLWIADLVTHDTAAVQAVMWQRYGRYLTDLQDEAFRDAVFAYIDAEDTPRSVWYQMDLLRRTGFTYVELLHKNGSFAAFGGVKGKG